MYLEEIFKEAIYASKPMPSYARRIIKRNPWNFSGICPYIQAY